jgi:hypothetical protein
MAETFPFQSGNEENDAAQKAKSQVYTNEEVSEIIRVALRNAEKQGADTVVREDMLAIGRDFGLSENDIDQAFEEIYTKSDEEKISEQAMLGLKIHAITYGMIAAGLFAINFMTTPDYWWAFFPAVAWGMFFGIHWILVKFMPSVAIHLTTEVTEQAKEHMKDNKFNAYAAGARVNFKIPDLYGSLAEVKGLVQTNDDQILIEYDVRDTIFGAAKSKVKELVIPASDLSSVQFDRKLLYTRLTLSGRRMKTFSSIPGSNAEGVRLYFGRENRDASEHLFEEIRDMIEKKPA